MSFRERIIWMLGLNFALALAPLVFNAFSGAGVGWFEAIRRGELILVAIASGASAIATAAQAEPRERPLRELKALIIVAGVIFVVSSGFIYADNFRAIRRGDPESVTAASAALFSGAVALGWYSTVLAHRCGEEAR